METSEVRLLLRDSVLEAEMWRLTGMRVAPVSQRLYGTRVDVAVRPRPLFVDIELRIQRGGVPSGRGAFTLTRSTTDGAASEFRLQTREETGSFLVVRPAGARSRMDVYHLGEARYRDVLLPAAFRDLVVSPLDRIVALSAAKVDWPFLLHTGTRADDARVEALARAIRVRLPTLLDADDGAVAEDGTYVFIADERPQAGGGGLNCSGFVKWVVDGYYYPLRIRNTSVAAAKRTLDSARGNTLSSSLYYMDPYFGLDWTRNLAALLDEARGGLGVRRGVEYFDIRSVDRLVYTEDLGYPVRDLPLLLYTLAVMHPGSFYLASVNGVLDEDEGLRQHFHTLALLPFFEADGVLETAVFERTRETDLASVLRRYAGLQIHLVRLEAEGRFAPLGEGRAGGFRGSALADGAPRT
jgi:hypothetical protein